MRSDTKRLPHYSTHNCVIYINLVTISNHSYLYMAWTSKSSLLCLKMIAFSHLTDIYACNIFFFVWQDSTKFAYELARDVRHRPLGVLTPGTDLLQPLEVFLNQLMPDDGHMIATNRLFISVTNSETKKNEMVSTFESKQELIEVWFMFQFITHKNLVFWLHYLLLT